MIIKVRDRDDANHEAACGDNFWKEASEDILLEIFIRLPDSRSAIRTASVCQHWHSVISKNPHFIPRFKSHHHQLQHRYPLPYAIFFREADGKPEFAGPQHFQPICKLLSDEPVLASTNFLDFLPCPMVIRGSCNDLLLVSPGPRNSKDLYICNPFTKQFIQIPRGYCNFDYDIVGYALVCMSGPTNEFRFKVVGFYHTLFPDSNSVLPQNVFQPIVLFCSESRKWKIRRFYYPGPTFQYAKNWLHGGVACNGILYWIEFECCSEINRVIYLDLSNDECGAIDFPSDSCRVPLPRDQIGVVRVRGVEELRLLQVILTTSRESTVDLKVWKLSHTNKKEWVLVHKNKLEKSNPKTFNALPFVHPTNGDALFMVWDQRVFQYNLKDTNTSKCVLIGKEPLAVCVGWEASRDRLLQYPVMHTYWPTHILTCDDFWNEAPEDILLEIFIRLPDSRSAIRTAAVCHKWNSLISQNPQFIPSFESHHHRHQHRYPLPYTIIFRKADFEKPVFPGPQYYQPICKLSDQESMLCTTTNFLDFIMPCSPMVIRGSCNDLLLVSPGPRKSTHLYICNPFTKQFVRLPEIPRPYDGFERGIAGHALVCMPGPTNKFRFKVIEFTRTIYPNPDSELPHNTVQPIMSFCSESRKWELRHFRYPRPTTQYGINWLHGVACNGILYWLEFERCTINRVIYLDLSNNQCGAIDFPNNSCDDFCHAKDQIGVVRARGGEELRLLQVGPTTCMESTVDLMVWKLSVNDHTNEKEWVLVHHKNELEKPDMKRFLALPFVHPTNGDVVFIVWGRKVFQYNLEDTTSTYELIGKLQEDLVKRNVVGEGPRDRLLQFPVMQTYWPTHILT